jgi:hypothetical protein
MSNPDGRSLSPITELTTPASFRTIALPRFESLDYTSEREASPDGSVLSHGSGRTVTPQIIEGGHDGDHDASSSAPEGLANATSPPNSASSDPSAYFYSSSSPTIFAFPIPFQRIPSATSSPPPVGVSAPENDDIRQRYIERKFPRPDGEDEAIPESGMAGIGAGSGRMSRPNSTRSRPSSFHAGKPDTIAVQPGGLVSLRQHRRSPLSLGIPGLGSEA